jgi:serine protease DegS
LNQHQSDIQSALQTTKKQGASPTKRGYDSPSGSFSQVFSKIININNEIAQLLKKTHYSIAYILNWILFGLLAGLVILLMQGRIQIIISGQDIGPSKNNQRHDLQQASYSDAVAEAAPSVVSIHIIRLVEKTQTSPNDRLLELFLNKHAPPAPQLEKQISSGSGVILDSRGYVLTNYHVIADAEAVQVTLNDGRRTIAKMVGNDPDTDLAVLKIDLDKLPQARIADINNVHIGDIVLAIGYPFKIGQTVTQGIISATGRTQVSSSTYENFLQTDAAINPGNSGGALININGEIVGINSLIFTKTGGFQGIGFAIPIDLAKSVMEQITEHGYVVRGWLGVEGVDLSQQILNKIGLPDIKGILVTSVDRGGPGDKAGLKPGDIITHINGEQLTSVIDILNKIAAGKPGDTFDIEGIRQRQSFSTEAVLGQRPMMSRQPE